jgi:hypothetical protein
VCGGGGVLGPGTLCSFVFAVGLLWCMLVCMLVAVGDTGTTYLYQATQAGEGGARSICVQDSLQEWRACLNAS